MPTTIRLAAAFVLLALSSQMAAAQVLFQSWVSRNGSGTDCSEPLPCSNFAAAHNATHPGGQISCVDSGDYGPVMITKAITINCTGVHANVSTSDCSAPVGVCNSINIAAGANDTVRLEGLIFEQPFGANAAIRFVSGAALHVRNVSIDGYTCCNGGVGVGGIGILFTPANGVAAKLFVEDTRIGDSGFPGAGGGIVIQPTGTGSARVGLHRVVIENNTYGVFANGTGSTGVIAVQIRDSLVTGSKFNGISAFTSAGHSTTSITVDHTASTLNGADGILSQGANAFVFLKGSTVMSNTTGLNSVSGGAIFSYQDNALTGNVTDGAPTAVLAVR